MDEPASVRKPARFTSRVVPCAGSSRHHRGRGGKKGRAILQRRHDLHVDHAHLAGA
jgi:hypothetical protein